MGFAFSALSIVAHNGSFLRCIRPIAIHSRGKIRLHMINLVIALALTAAAPHKGPIMAYGFPDDDSCGTWTQHKGDAIGLALRGWLFGLVTGYNTYGSGSGGLKLGIKAEGLTAWTQAYCQAHPLDSVSTAGFRLIDELKRREGQNK